METKQRASATYTGLPEEQMRVDRRRLLLGLAAASTAAAAVTAGTAKASESETPELLSLADALPHFEAEYQNARAEVRRIVRRFQPTWPRAPEEIHTHGWKATEERALAGWAYQYKEGQRGYYANWERPISIGTVETFESEIDTHRRRIAHIMTTKSKRGLKSEQLWLARAETALPLARSYWAKVERIRTASGYDTAVQCEHDALAALKAHVDKIMVAPEHTMQGVVIKAQALAAWGRIERHCRVLNIEGVEWPTQMAEAIMRQAERSA